MIKRVVINVKISIAVNLAVITRQLHLTTGEYQVRHQEKQNTTFTDTFLVGVIPEASCGGAPIGCLSLSNRLNLQESEDYFSIG